jgi:hypothetical protein
MSEGSGVFARNHRQYLQYAADVGRVDPRRLVTFRSSRRWVSAARLLERAKALPVYFATVNGKPRVVFEGTLRRVLVDPADHPREAKRLLQLVPPETEEEGLWDGSVGTLYAISACHSVKPFSISGLTKRDGKPIDEGFNYSYAVVESTRPRVDSARIAVDIEEPPARAHALVTRVIRDTSLVQRLKQLHDDRCQRCGVRLETGPTMAYSEAHHVRPLGAPHKGPDIDANVVVVCPNCHALLDLCAVELDLGELRQHPEHKVGAAYLAYHNKLCADARRRGCA